MGNQFNNVKEQPLIKNKRLGSRTTEVNEKKKNKTPQNKTWYSKIRIFINLES